MRSLLTTLGILIGVAAVIMLLAVGTGSSRAVQDQITALGTNTLTVTVAGGNGGGALGGPGGGGAAARSAAAHGPPRQNATSRPAAAELTLDDAEAIVDQRRRRPTCSDVAPVVTASVGHRGLHRRHAHRRTRSSAPTPSYLRSTTRPSQYGTPLHRHRLHAHRWVVAASGAPWPTTCSATTCPRRRQDGPVQRHELHRPRRAGREGQHRLTGPGRHRDRAADLGAGQVHRRTAR